MSAIASTPGTMTAEPARPALRERAGLIRALLGLSFALLLLPPLVAPVPPLWDYPNHLARLWLLGGGAATPPMADWYRVVWDNWTNVAVDALASRLIPLIGWMAVGRSLVVAAILLPPLGAAALWRVTHGRLHAWMLVFAPMAWGTTLIGGFLNFQVAVGLALLAASADAALGRRGTVVRLLARLLISAALIGVHLFGFVFYAGLLAALAIGPHWRGMRHTLRALTAVVASLAVPAIAFLLAAPRLPGAEVGAGLPMLIADFVEGWHNFAGYPAGKILRSFLLVTAYQAPLDVLTAGILLAPVLLSAALGRLRVHLGLLLAAIGFAIAYLVCPERLGGTYWIDARFAVMAPFAAAAAVRPDLPALSARIMACALFGIACLRTGSIASIWHERQADVAALVDVLQAVEPGALILPVQQRPADRSTVPIGRLAVFGASSYRHLPALATPLRHAFIPTLFAARGKQPLQVTDAMRDLAEPEGGELADVDALRNPSTLARELPAAPYLREWRDRFDYVLVVNADVPGLTAPLTETDVLTLRADAGFARLYQIKPGRTR